MKSMLSVEIYKNICICICICAYVLTNVRKPGTAPDIYLHTFLDIIGVFWAVNKGPIGEAMNWGLQKGLQFYVLN